MISLSTVLWACAPNFFGIATYERLLLQIHHSCLLLIQIIILLVGGAGSPTVQYWGTRVGMSTFCQNFYFLSVPQIWPYYALFYAHFAPIMPFLKEQLK